MDFLSVFINFALCLSKQAGQTHEKKDLQQIPHIWFSRGEADGWTGGYPEKKWGGGSAKKAPPPRPPRGCTEWELLRRLQLLCAPPQFSLPPPSFLGMRRSNRGGTGIETSAPRSGGDGGGNFFEYRSSSSSSSNAGAVFPVADRKKNFYAVSSCFALELSIGPSAAAAAALVVVVLVAGRQQSEGGKAATAGDERAPEFRTPKLSNRCWKRERGGKEGKRERESKTHTNMGLLVRSTRFVFLTSSFPFFLCADVVLLAADFNGTSSKTLIMLER